MLSLLVPREQGGREGRFRAQTMGAGSLQCALALYLIDTTATCRSEVSMEPGRSSLSRERALLSRKVEGGAWEYQLV